MLSSYCRKKQVSEPQCFLSATHLHLLTDLRTLSEVHLEYDEQGSSARKLGKERSNVPTRPAGCDSDCLKTRSSEGS